MYRALNTKLNHPTKFAPDLIRFFKIFKKVKICFLFYLIVKKQQNVASCGQMGVWLLISYLFHTQLLQTAFFRFFFSFWIFFNVVRIPITHTLHSLSQKLLKNTKRVNYPRAKTLENICIDLGIIELGRKQRSYCYMPDRSELNFKDYPLSI